jgi:hypothetical protein
MRLEEQPDSFQISNYNVQPELRVLLNNPLLTAALLRVDLVEQSSNQPILLGFPNSRFPVPANSRFFFLFYIMITIVFLY